MEYQIWATSARAHYLNLQHSGHPIQKKEWSTRLNLYIVSNKQYTIVKVSSGKSFLLLFFIYYYFFSLLRYSVPEAGPSFSPRFPSWSIPPSQYDQASLESRHWVGNSEAKRHLSTSECWREEMKAHVLQKTLRQKDYITLNHFHEEFLAYKPSTPDALGIPQAMDVRPD